MNKILLYLQAPDDIPVSTAYSYVFAMAVGLILRYVLENQAVLIHAKIKIRLHNVLMSLIFQKSLQRLQKEVNENENVASSGKINSLFSNDAGTVAHWGALVYLPVLAVIQCLVNIVFLISLIGWSALVGVGVMIFMIFFGGPLAGAISKEFLKLTKARDARIDAIEKMLLRMLELSALQRSILFSAFSKVYWYTCPVLVSFFTFVTFTKLAGGELTANIAFTSLALFNLLRVPLQGVPDNTNTIINVWIAYKRIERFLEEDEHAKYTNDIRAHVFKPNGLTLIVGPTGSGKSSFLIQLWGKMSPSSHKTSNLALEFNKLRKYGVAYVGETLFILNTTIRENFLFGMEFAEEKYHNVIRACALMDDINDLEFGDLTLAGEAGINLSGGQKQRIALARAVYSSARTVLLDSPLSAVDSRTAKDIVLNVISGPKALLKNTTRIVVSHNIALLLNSADRLIVIDKRILYNDGVHEVVKSMRSKGDTQGLYSEIISSFENRDDVNSELHRSPDNKADNSTQRKEEENLHEEEKVIRESVQWSVYWMYLPFAGGTLFVISLALAYSLNHGMAIAQDFWVKV
ncbi:hypothetical protein HK098_005161 [Nowakowskiella sp. JEL0407]|nr:hypothetical protein HK098_005161 [Nowakowskiella sp. JEL0407]